MKSLLLATLICCFAMPASAFAAEAPVSIPGREGQTLVELGGRITWLNQDEIEGIKSWQVEVKCYRGDELLQGGHSLVSVVDGHTGFAQGSRGIYRRNPYTGFYQSRTRYGFLAYVDARHPDGLPLTGTDFFLQPILAQAKAFTFGELLLYVHCEGADRFEAQIYSTRTPGYNLDDTLPIPVATQLDEMPRQLEGTLRGELDPAAPPIYRPNPDHLPGMLVQTNDGEGLMVINDAGEVLRVVRPLPRTKVKE